MAETNVNDEEAKSKAISGRLSDHFGFKLSDAGSISSLENDYSVTCNKSFKHLY